MLLLGVTVISCLWFIETHSHDHGGHVNAGHHAIVTMKPIPMPAYHSSSHDDHGHGSHDEHHL